MATAVARMPAVAVLAVTAVVGGGLTLHGLAAILPPERWPAVFLDGRLDAIDAVVAWYSWLPRLVTSLLAGAALGLAGALLQLALRNPLAAPATLGVTAGAQLGLIGATLGLPLIGLVGRDAAALLGGGMAAGIACAVGLRRGASSLTLILAGLLVSLYLGALGAVLLLFHREELGNVFIWGAGSLAQYGWAAAAELAWRLATVVAAVVLGWRALALLVIPEAAHGLGVSVAAVRVAAIALAVVLSASVTARVGVIGFVGLAAPALARLAGVRRPAARLLWGSVFGAAILWVTDQTVQAVAGRGAEAVPTGAAVALIGGPLILVLLLRLRAHEPGSSVIVGGSAAARPGRRAAIGLAVLTVAGALALLVGVTPAGHLAVPEPGLLGELLQWRWPRVATAAGAGALFGIAGTAIQRLTGNPMASPEITGVSAGAALGLVLVVWFAPAAGRLVHTGAAGLGAVAVLGMIALLGRRNGFAPERILLAGVALTAFLDAVITAVLASGDPRAGRVLTWLSGSAYSTGPAEAVMVGVALAVALILVVVLRRWLDLLVLGGTTAAALGAPVVGARAASMGLVAVTTALGTMLLGPLSFVGLMAPHMARFQGLVRAPPQALGAALLGASMMVLADWLGRVLVFPREIPAGLVATMLGGPYLLWLMRRAAR